MKPPSPSFRQLPRRGPVAAALLGAVLIAACSTPPPTHYHTLMVPPQAASAASPAPARAAPAPAWELLPVGIPVQVDRPQMVVRLADGSLAVVEQERWIAPLADELHASLTERLTDALGVAAASPRSPRERWRLRIDVQRFDSTLGGAAGLAVEWRLRGSEDQGPTALRCHAVYEQAVQPGYAALAAGHRGLLARLVEDIARSLGELDAGRNPGCPQVDGLGSRDADASVPAPPLASSPGSAPAPSPAPAAAAPSARPAARAP